jgi:hypothetical protein
MEFEQNPGDPDFVLLQKSRDQIFTEQLHAIDEAINFVPNMDGPNLPNPDHGISIF